MTTTPESTAPRRAHDLRTGLAFAAAMFAIALGSRWAGAFGVALPNDFASRALMVLAGVYLMVSGNSIPKRLVPLSAWGASPARVQSFLRFAGWAWVLVGLALVFVWLALPSSLVTIATLTLVPAGMLLVAWRWTDLASARTPRG